MWTSLIGALGQLGVAVFAFSGRARSTFSTAVGTLALVFATWTFAAAAHTQTGEVAWRALDLSSSPFVPPLALLVVTSFTGTLARYRRQVVISVCVALGLSLVGVASADQPALSWIFSVAYVCFVVPTTLLALHIILEHRRRAKRQEATNAGGIAAALALSAILGLTELAADIELPVPRLGHFASTLVTLTLLALGARASLFGTEARQRVKAPLLIVAILLVAFVVLFVSLEPDPMFRSMGSLLLATIAVLVVTTIARDRAQQHVRRSQLELQGRMTAQLAHDLNTPIATLRGALSELEQLRPAEGTEERAMLEIAQRQVARLSETVSRYMRLTRFEVERSEITLAELTEELRAANVVLDIRDPEALAYVDVELIRRVLSNLVKNSEEAGANSISLSVRIDGGHLLLAIYDDGCGMNARTRQQALDGFFTTKADGTGLGLAFARRVALAHGGELEVEGAESVGTLIRLRVPQYETRLASRKASDD